MMALGGANAALRLLLRPLLPLLLALLLVSGRPAASLAAPALPPLPRALLLPPVPLLLLEPLLPLPLLLAPAAGVGRRR